MQTPETEIVVTGADGAELLRAVLAPGDYILGRNPECELRVQADLVSRRHAQITINFDHALVEDLGSSNGTLINGQAIKGCTRLWPNQKIQLGTATVELRRLKSVPLPDVSLAPMTAAVRRILPDEFLRDKKYDIGGVVAKGGMGAILDAKEATIERKVAMKVMLDGYSPDDLTRFIGEAKITGQLEHPNIVPVHELGVDENDQVFYTMKFVRGITLRKILDLMAASAEATNRKYPLAALLTIFQKICDAVAFAHSKSVIHRDLKPENFMLGDFGEVLVMDWGLAKLLHRKEEENTSIGDTLRSVVRPVPQHETDFSGTLDGSIMGTPQYMAPEQARGEVEALDTRTDIYALGAILFHILYLRPPVSGRNVTEIVDKVGKGLLDWPDAKTTAAKKLPHLPSGRVPDSLLAVCRKALALAPETRYQSVASLQKDIAAYQAGFATSAERAGLGKQLVLLVKRHKTSAIAAILVILTALGFGTKAIIAGRRAEREAIRANRALADLKKTAPTLLALAGSEASFQRFASAQEKLDAAIALDPELKPAYWRRAYLLIGQERWSEAATAFQIAREKDPANSSLASILPTVEEFASILEQERWTGKRAEPLIGYLTSVGASGELAALSTKLRLGAEPKRMLVRNRLTEWLGQGAANWVTITASGFIHVDLRNRSIDTLDPLQGLPIDELDASSNQIASIEGLRGMRLSRLWLYNTKVTDLSPLKGMPLREFSVSEGRVSDVSALEGAPLENFSCAFTGPADFSVLHNAPFRRVVIASEDVDDLHFVAHAPLEELQAEQNHISDLSPLRGKPLRRLLIYNNQIHDLGPLRGTPIEELSIYGNPVSDFAPLLDLPKLERLRVTDRSSMLVPLRQHPALKFISIKEGPYRPVSEFWAEYDADHAGKE